MADCSVSRIGWLYQLTSIIELVYTSSDIRLFFGGFGILLFFFFFIISSSLHRSIFKIMEEEIPKPNETYSSYRMEPVTQVSFELTGLTIMMCSGIYLCFGLWSVRTLIFTRAGLELRWLTVPFVLALVGSISSLLSTFPIALAIGLVYTSSNTVVGELPYLSLAIALLILFYSFGTVKLTYSM